MHFQIIFINIVFFCIFVFLINSSLGVKIENDLTEAKIGATKNTSILNRQQNSNDKRIKSSSEITTTSAPSRPTASDENTVTYRLSGASGATCILIKTDAIIEFKYKNSYKEDVNYDSYVPGNYEASGNCENQDDAYIQISWSGYVWSVYFSKTPGGEHWYVSKMELTLDSKAMSKSLPHLNSTAKSLKFSTPQEHTMIFPTPVGKAYTCSESAPVEMKGRNVVALLLLRELKMQPFMFKKDFGPEFVCSPGGVKSFRDETAPIAVGSTLAIVTLLTVTGYGIYRYMKVKKVQYDTME